MIFTLTDGEHQRNFPLFFATARCGWTLTLYLVVHSDFSIWIPNKFTGRKRNGERGQYVHWDIVHWDLPHPTPRYQTWDLPPTPLPDTRHGTNPSP